VNSNHGFSITHTQARCLAGNDYGGFAWRHKQHTFSFRQHPVAGKTPGFFTAAFCLASGYPSSGPNSFSPITTIHLGRALVSWSLLPLIHPGRLPGSSLREPNVSMVSWRMCSQVIYQGPPVWAIEGHLLRFRRIAHSALCTFRLEAVVLRLKMCRSQGCSHCANPTTITPKVR